ncbi:MAG: 30S ribosomal protein S9 [Bacteroidia bacterium]|nr:30S ribosomal protein S9 [Bacteroidia bacterium]
MEAINTIGRRKSSIARIYFKPGKGKVQINSKELKEYFPVATHQNLVTLPLSLLNANNTYDIEVNVSGGGITGQADAIKLAIARALCEVDPENRPVLKQHKLLTRDPRMVERKKFGQKKARKRFQFSKR